MEEDSNVNMNGFDWPDCWRVESSWGWSLFDLNGLPLKTGLKRSSIEISNSHKHGARVKLNEIRKFFLKKKIEYSKLVDWKNEENFFFHKIEKINR